MRIAVTGSIANDHLMRFPGRFADLLPSADDPRLSLSFLVDEIEIRRGGAAANVAFGLGQLGLSPILVGAAGRDFQVEYEPFLLSHGVDTGSVRIVDTLHTARFVCTTDEDECQIASFYSGAMREASAIEMGEVLARVGHVDVVVVGPNDPDAMLAHTAQVHDLGIPVVADPSQQMARMPGEQIRPLVDGAAILVTNDHELEICTRKTGWGTDELLDRVGALVTTHGADGVTIRRRGREVLHVGSVPVREGVDVEPTGAGDGFRAGFLAGLAAGYGYETAARLGCLLATQAIESVGPQEYRLGDHDQLQRLEAAYGAVPDGLLASWPAIPVAERTSLGPHARTLDPSGAALT